MCNTCIMHHCNWSRRIRLLHGFDYRLPRSGEHWIDWGIQKADTVHIPGLHYRFEIQRFIYCICLPLVFWFMDVSRIITFRERRFPGSHFPGKCLFLESDYPGNVREAFFSGTVQFALQCSAIVILCRLSSVCLWRECIVTRWLKLGSRGFHIKVG